MVACQDIAVLWLGRLLWGSQAGSLKMRLFFFPFLFSLTFFAPIGAMDISRQIDLLSVEGDKEEGNLKTILRKGGSGSTVGASFKFVCELAREDRNGMQELLEEITSSIRFVGGFLRRTGKSLGLFPKMVDGLLKKQEEACQVFQKANDEKVTENESDSVIFKGLRETLERSNQKTVLLEGVNKIVLARVLGCIKHKNEKVVQGFKEDVLTIPGMSLLVPPILKFVADPKREAICEKSLNAMARTAFLKNNEES